jgi:tryptophan synthase alpha chain
MNRLNQLFNTKKQDLLSIYFTAGYPALNTTIQASSQQALENGMTLNVLFEELKELRKRVTIPIIMMGYCNPMVQYSVERFCQTAAEVGVDGVIVPDLPMYEYENLYRDTFAKYGLSNIFLVTPQTSEERIRKIDALSNSFIYLLSSSSITGGSLNVSDNIEAYYNRVKAMQLKNPLIIGFGISNNATFTKACQYANGAIVGSAFVKYLGSRPDYLAGIGEFIGTIR